MIAIPLPMNVRKTNVYGPAPLGRFSGPRDTCVLHLWRPVPTSLLLGHQLSQMMLGARRLVPFALSLPYLPARRLAGRVATGQSLFALLFEPTPPTKRHHRLVGLVPRLLPPFRPLILRSFGTGLVGHDRPALLQERRRIFAFAERFLLAIALVLVAFRRLPHALLVRVRRFVAVMRLRGHARRPPTLQLARVTRALPPVPPVHPLPPFVPPVNPIRITRPAIIATILLAINEPPAHAAYPLIAHSIGPVPLVRVAMVAAPPTPLSVWVTPTEPTAIALLPHHVPAHL